MIKGKRITLKPLREEDLPQFAEKLVDLEIMGEHVPMRLASETSLRKRFDDNGLLGEDRGTLLIWTQDRVIGMISYFNEPSYADGYELGYFLWDASARRKGYTTEAVRLLARYLFTTKKINRLTLMVSTENDASTRVAQKAGFTLEGVARGALFAGGRHQDMQMFSLLRSELGEE